MRIDASHVEQATADDEDDCLVGIVAPVQAPPPEPVHVEPTEAAALPAHVANTGPILLELASGAKAGTAVGCNAPASVFPVETDAFVGRIYMRFRGLPDEPSDYFSDRKSVRMSGVVQGRFKREGLTIADCVTGYEFEQPFAYVPARFIVRGALKVAHALAPTLTEDVLGKRPYLLNPMFQTIQVLHVAKPGEEPPITAILQESTALLGGVFAERAVAAGERKKYFASLSHGAKHAIDPSHVYTMEFSEDKIDPTTFELLLIGMRFKLSTYLGLQPLAYPMGKLGFTPFSDDYLFNVHVRHVS